MGKRILIGSIIAVVILLLMPSIPAIQMKTIDDEILDRVRNKIEMDLPDDFPLLFLFMLTILLFRFGTTFILVTYSIEIDIDVFDIIHPILLAIGILQFGRLLLWEKFWISISKILGLDWFEAVGI